MLESDHYRRSANSAANGPSRHIAPPQVALRKGLQDIADGLTRRVGRRAPKLMFPIIGRDADQMNARPCAANAWNHPGMLIHVIFSAMRRN
jgi:hypothetical protein